MNSRSIILVQRSFRDIVPISHEIGTIFYARLFQKSPELRALFTTDIDTQADKLLQMLAMIVNGLHRLDAFGAAVRDSGRRHQDYGVLAKHLSWLARRCSGRWRRRYRTSSPLPSGPPGPMPMPRPTH